MYQMFKLTSADFRENMIIEENNVSEYFVYIGTIEMGLFCLF